MYDNTKNEFSTLFEVCYNLQAHVEVHFSKYMLLQ